MGTAAARTLLFIVIMLIGFRKLWIAKLSERSLFEFTIVMIAAELAFFAVISPDEPLVPFLVPLVLLIAVYRLYVFLKKLPSKMIKENQSSLLKEGGTPGIEAQPYSAAADPGTFYTGEIHPPMGLPLIESGKVCGDNLKRIGRTYLWLRQELRKFGYRDIRQVNYLTIDQAGNFFMDLKKGSRNH